MYDYGDRKKVFNLYPNKTIQYFTVILNNKLKIQDYAPRTPVNQKLLFL